MKCLKSKQKRQQIADVYFFREKNFKIMNNNPTGHYICYIDLRHGRKKRVFLKRKKSAKKNLLSNCERIQKISLNGELYQNSNVATYITTAR